MGWTAGRGVGQTQLADPTLRRNFRSHSRRRFRANYSQGDQRGTTVCTLKQGQEGILRVHFQDGTFGPGNSLK